MIEINKLTGKRDPKNKIKGKGKAASSTKETTFAQELQKTVTHEYQGSIEELMNDLKDKEKRFLDMQSFHELQQYKTVVQKILKKVLDEGFTTATLKRRRKDRADFTIISEINEKLQAVTNSVAKGNKAFNLMKTIEEIRGLVFDLVY